MRDENEATQEEGSKGSLWGGRFSDGPGDEMWEFTVDRSDRRLLGDDVTGSLAHVAMLERVGLLTSDDAASLNQGLKQVREEARIQSFEFHELSRGGLSTPSASRLIGIGADDTCCVADPPSRLRPQGVSACGVAPVRRRDLRL